MRCAVIEEGVVVNVVVVSDLEAMPGVLLVPAEDAGNVGDQWDGEKFVPPANTTAPSSIVPQRVPMLNAHLVLIQAGWMPAVEGFIDAMAEPQRSLVRAYLTQSLTMARDHEMVLAIPAALGKTEAEVDQLFIIAGAMDA